MKALMSRKWFLAVLTVMAVIWPTAAARADYTFYRTSPHVGACWNKVNAYGGVYQVTSLLLNGTSTGHTMRVQVYRPGTGIIQDESVYAAPGEWKVAPIANVSLVLNDEYRYQLDGVQVVAIPQNGIPYHMNNCQVTESPSVKIRQAISYGMSQLDAHYTGCWGGSYRMGAVAPYEMSFDGRNCRQSWIYVLPAGHAGFDCSGLMYKMFQAAGVYFPWTSSGAMYDNLPAVPKSQLRVGDLLVTNGHVAMYVGDGDGDGIRSYLEATPYTTVRYLSSVKRESLGVVVRELAGSADYMNQSSFVVRRVPGT